MRILIAEDEQKLGQFICNALRESGHVPDLVHRGDEALARALATPYDAMVLDLFMPGRDGLSVLRQLRENRNNVPVLILTARGEVSERIEGLNLGADDYMAKPFAMDELVARLNALGRRSGERVTLFKLADLTVNLLTREVERAGRRIELSQREYALLDALLRVPGKVLSRTQLCERVWDYHFDTGTNVVDVYVQRLRRKIDEGHEVRLVQTVRGVGYVLRAETAAAIA